jgi:CHAT domain-containing protein
LVYPPDDLAMRVERTLPPDAALFSFHLRGSESWLWAVDREGLELLRLPPPAEVNRQVTAFSAALKRDPEATISAGTRLYATLFGSLPPRFRRRSRWLLSLDRNLFQVPVAALVEHSGSQTVYVAERHVIQVIPGVLPWLECAARQRARRVYRIGPAPILLGIGDAIYNQADPRLDKRAHRLFPHHSPFGLFAAEPPPGLTLPRLAASAAELAACARAWRGESKLLEGSEATRARLMDELRRNPAVIHLATHFVASTENSSHLVFEDSAVRREAGTEEMIALTLDPAGENELLTASDVTHWPVHAELVSLSGCHSGAGAALPGVGLLGLTRSWLAAGARSVVSSLWDTPDESGALFTALYRNMSSGLAPDPAKALNSAQREMIRAGGWFGQPRYWGAYFVVTNE